MVDEKQRGSYHGQMIRYMSGQQQTRYRKDEHFRKYCLFCWLESIFNCKSPPREQSTPNCCCLCTGVWSPRNPALATAPLRTFSGGRPIDNDWSICYRPITHMFGERQIMTGLSALHTAVITNSTDNLTGGRSYKQDTSSNTDNLTRRRSYKQTIWPEKEATSINTLQAAQTIRHEGVGISSTDNPAWRCSYKQHRQSGMNWRSS